MSDFDPGVPLAHYRRHKADVLLDCDNCALSRTLPLERVIARLNARGLDGENVGIRAVARYTLGACPRCGKRAWSTRPAFAATPGRDGLSVAPSFGQ